MRLLISKIADWFGRRGSDREFDAEVEEHLRLMTEDYVGRGMTQEEAARRARIEFGGVGQSQQSMREARGLPGLDELWHNIKCSLRVLRKSPGFTIVSVLTLGLGVGVNTTIFTAYNSVALKLLPLRDAREIVRIEREFESRSLGNTQYFFSYPEYLALRDHNDSFSDLAAVSYPFFALARTAGGEPEKLRCALASPNYFPGLGVGVTLGRVIGSGPEPGIMLSHGYWTRRFNADPGIPGRAIQLNPAEFTVIGVAPSDFIGTNVPPEPVDVWAPIALQPQLLPSRPLDDNSASQRLLQLLGRLKPGVSPSRAGTETLVLMTRFQADHPPLAPADAASGPRRAADRTIAIKLPAATLFGNTDDPRFTATFVFLIALVGTVLLIGCANLANMLMARASGRQREFAVRLALGAGRWRLVRQLLTECILLGILGGAAGLVLSSWLSRVLAHALNTLLADFFITAAPFVIDTSLDVRVVGYAMTVALLAGCGFGLLPALRFSKPDVNSALKNEGSTLGRSLGGSRVRSILVGGQAGISILLLITAGLLTRGLIRSRAVRPGFETANAFALIVDYGSDVKRAVALQRQVEERLRTLPGIRGVALSDRIPMLGTWTPRVKVKDVFSRAGANRVMPEFFPTMGVPILEGRSFTRAECAAQARVIVISEAAALHLWPGGSALGQHVSVDMTFRGDWVEFEVAGVARDVRQSNLSRVDPAFFYFPVKTDQVQNLLFTTNGDNRAATAAVRAVLESIDGNLPFSMQLMNLEQVPVRLQRLMSKIGAIFALCLAGLALSLAAVGIYGVMAYLVSQRVKEIGIRMALGADSGNVVTLVVWQGLRPVFLGAIAGFLAAAAASALMHSQLQFPGTPDMLYGLSAFDPPTFLGLTLFLALTALLASWIPARRASRVDPMVALRYE